jgi:peptidoglycan/LPS O-acetylase OafA/YrhL
MIPKRARVRRGAEARNCKVSGRMALSTTMDQSKPQSTSAGPATATTAAAATDPLLAPPASMEQPPLVRDERPPLRPSLLDVSPVGRRMENLDALRIVCMFVIIVTHVTEPFLDSLERRHGHFGPLALAILSINVMGRFGVPCFMMISFYIYWHQLYDKGRTWGELMARRFKRLVPAFVVWSAFYFLVHRQLYRKFGNAEFYTHLNEYGYSVFKWRTWWDLLLGRAEYHLYYLPLVIQCLLCIPLLKLLWKRPVVSWTWIGVTALAWTLMIYGPVLFAPHSAGRALTDGITKVMYQPWAIPFLLFPLFGMMCAGQRAFRNFLAHGPTSFWVGLIVFSLALHAAEAMFLTRALPGDLLRIAVFVKLGRILSGFAVFALFIRSPLMRDPLPRVSHYAFGLHFMHPFIITVLLLIELRLLGPAVAHFERFAVPVLAVNLVLTLTITFGLCLLIGRFKRLEFLVV